MFEYEQDIVNALLSENVNFKRLYDKHHELKERVNMANAGAEPMDDFSLETLKKQKLMLKDQMAAIIEQYRRSHPAQRQSP